MWVITEKAHYRSLLPYIVVTFRLEQALSTLETGALDLKVLTQTSFLLRIRFYTPKGPPKHISKKCFPKKDFDNPSGHRRF